MSGVKREWVAPHNFAILRFDLVRALGGSYEAAVLLDRIIYFGKDEGWLATREEMQEACVLSVWRLDQAVKTLREAGFITDRRESHLDNTRRWSVLYETEETTHDVVQDSSVLVVQDSCTTPSSKKSKNFMSAAPTEGDESPKRTLTLAPDSFPITPQMREWWNTKGRPDLNVLAETEKFLDWHRVNGKRRVNWTRAWQNWMNRAADRRPQNNNHTAGSTNMFEGFR